MSFLPLPLFVSPLCQAQCLHTAHTVGGCRYHALVMMVEGQCSWQECISLEWLQMGFYCPVKSRINTLEKQGRAAITVHSGKDFYILATVPH